MGRNFRKVIEMQTGGWRQDRATGAWHQDVEAYYVPISCNHCADPACVKVCPTKAHHKRDTDGLVVIDTKKCVGCGLCAKACLYGVPVLNPATRKMSKCDACADRLDHGLQPICVESCPQRAIEFGPIDARDSSAQGVGGISLAGAPSGASRPSERQRPRCVVRRGLLSGTKSSGRPPLVMLM